MKLFPNSLLIAFVFIISICLSCLWLILELISIIIDNASNFFDEQSVKIRLSSFSNWLDSTRFGEIEPIKKYLDGNKELQKLIESIQTQVLYIKMKKSDNYYHSSLNINENFVFFREAIDAFSKLSEDELQDIKVYLLIPQKKYWVFQLGVPFLGMLSSPILIPVVSSILGGVLGTILGKSKIENGTGLEDFIEYWKNLLGNESLGLFIFLLMYFLLVYYGMKIILTRFRVNNEHTRNVLLTLIDSALELKKEIN